MKLTKITATAFKGQSFTLDLADINFLVGSNFAGKTARTDAIRFLLLGYLPELGKTAAATFGLASGREMTVTGTLDNGVEIRRRRYLQGGTVKSDDNVPREFDEAAQFTVMLNAETYFALSDRERVNYIFANIPMPGAPIKIDDEIGKLVSHHLPPTANPQEFIDAAIIYLTGAVKSAKEHVAKMEKTTQGIAALRAADEQSLPLTRLDADRAVLVKKLEKLGNERGQLHAIYQQNIRSKERREQLTREIAAKAQLEQERTKLAGDIVGLTSKLEGIAEPTGIEKVVAAERELTMAVRATQQQRDANVTARSRISVEMAGISSKTCCPFCGADNTDWKRKKEDEMLKQHSSLVLADQELATKQTDQTEELDRLRAKLVEARNNTDTIASLRKAITAAEAQGTARENALALIAAKEQELAGLTSGDTAQIATDYQTADTAVRNANNELAQIDSARKSAMGREQDKKRLAEAELERDKAKEELAELTSAGKRLREIQAEMVAVAFKPLLETANSLFGTVLQTPIAYHDGEIGTWRSGVWVTHRTFSGTEKLLTYAAIQAALASKCPVKLMIMDELGRLDPENIEKLLRAADSAVSSGTIDQFIGIMPLTTSLAGPETANKLKITNLS